jgi:hypothetical protein
MLFSADNFTGDMEYIGIIMKDGCPHCGKGVEISINGLFPHGVSFRCECISNIKREMNLF